MSLFKDRFGRVYRCLRISITDRCNYRCLYCNPLGNNNFINRDKILTYEDINFVVDTLAKKGINKVRITGGEPLIRKDIITLITLLHRIEGIKEITLTTNGSLLHKIARKLYMSGVHRINISLDTLRAEKYAFITGGYDINTIFNNINLVKYLNFQPIKINTVIIKGFNDDEIIDFCHFAAKHNVVVRFIEFMPIGVNNWDDKLVISSQKLLDNISESFALKEVSEYNYHSSTSTYYKLSNGATIGFIAPLTSNFCHHCDRLRLTADGKIKPCLLSNVEINLFDTIRIRDALGLIKHIEESLLLKSKEHISPLNLKNCLIKQTMSSIGG